MSFLLAKRLSSFPPLLRLSFSFSTKTSDQEQKETPFLVKYLVSSFGFSPNRALKASTYSRSLASIKSSKQPDSVVRFLTDVGLSDSEIKAAVSFYPILLGGNVEKRLKPNVRRLMDAGVSGELLVQLIRRNPASLHLEDAPSHFLFWKDFVGNCDQVLLKVIRRNGLLLTYNIDKHFVPRINLLNEYGLSNHDIAQLLGNGYCILGIPRGSRMFLVSLQAFSGYSKDKLDRKVEFFKLTYGWSHEEVSCACKKFPKLLTLSENNIKETMNFLVRKAMLEPRSIACQPQLLSYSLQKRMVPRHHVLSTLAARELKINCSFSTACNLTEKKFLEKFVEPYKKDMPELMEAYLSSARNIPV